ncbi:MAG: lactate utilization protein [Deltaproteobacteria bacterium CG_4_8_14_3_um_filter_51_11]|nr:lactate utilization protein [bacterium]OIP38439.1 MAG: lactate utilization protein B/C [Desulfobacteraceae bacterium CG2_30_51_40]PIP48310.1 MAG: lactate utilization protein [Deltaproteobacteria bacterium CG23_combo_of_CG06-09_8_20_14_all_51_20]PIX18227.1 MAG: lactate utilization protein [Deltaproteobacteria bacterium CG_4_8_14_3_um_filter_51_11]PIY24912.1 MAG: lactate utilization protein [Deltaproteobacteria bacterium CG_4_10_14_3_um_filter_51_14]PJB39196.1 MAG: lactate utilization protein
MDKPVENYWRKRLEAVREALEANNFNAYVAQSSDDAINLVCERIIPETGAKKISWGGSMTFTGTGLYEKVKSMTGLEFIDVFDKAIPKEEVIEWRRRSLLADLFIAGTNAVTESGILVNLDMIGNRVAAITFGPKNVLLVVGRNKIVPDVDEAMMRIKNFAAPANAMRLDKKTPCVKTSFCEDCKSPDRICNNWTITEKSFPKGRIRVVLINQDLGL